MLVLTALTFGACKKAKDGAQGPQGNANVSAYTSTTTNASWTYNSAYKERDATMSVSAITSDVVTSGTIQVFLGSGSGSEWLAMPFSVEKVQFNYSYKLGQVDIAVTLSDGTVPNNPGGQQFKVVVIPSRAMMMAIIATNTKIYKKSRR